MLTILSRANLILKIIESLWQRYSYLFPRGPGIIMYSLYVVGALKFISCQATRLRLDQETNPASKMENKAVAELIYIVRLVVRRTSVFFRWAGSTSQVITTLSVKSPWMHRRCFCEWSQTCYSWKSCPSLILYYKRIQTFDITKLQARVFC